LPVGTRLGEFELRAVIGVGGFGIVYRAFDHALEREVAIKEYMPGALAARSATLQVSVISQGHAESFAAGLHSFVNEARLLARFDHPSLVKVHRYWEANGTAYMAMPFYDGRTLKALRKAERTPPNEHVLMGLLEPLLAALETLHQAGVVHRDVSPDNILVTEGGKPVLLDFGAARHAIGDPSQALTAILKPNFAPVEQYGETKGLRQGPWTDLYALGATLWFLITGTPPQPATARALGSGAESLADTRRPGLSMDFLRAVDWMMAPRPEHRPQSVAALREVLAGHNAPPIVTSPMPLQTETSWEHTVAHEPGSPHAPVLRPDLEALWKAAAGDVADMGRERAAALPPSERWRAQAQRTARRRRLTLLLALLCLTGAGALAWLHAPAWLPQAEALFAGPPVAAPAAAPAPPATAAPAPPALVTTPAASAPAAAAAPAPPPLPEPPVEEEAALPAERASITRIDAAVPESELKLPPVLPARRSAAAAKPAPALPTRDDAASLPPSRACSGEVRLAWYRCVKRACEASPQFAQSHECLQVREIEQRNVQRRERWVQPPP
jgi:serine/threonine protein kinase